MLWELRQNIVEKTPVTLTLKIQILHIYSLNITLSVNTLFSNSLLFSNSDPNTPF